MITYQYLQITNVSNLVIGLKIHCLVPHLELTSVTIWHSLKLYITLKHYQRLTGGGGDNVYSSMMRFNWKLLNLHIIYLINVSTNHCLQDKIIFAANYKIPHIWKQIKAGVTRNICVIQISCRVYNKTIPS